MFSSVLDLWKASYGSAKFVAINEEANDGVVHQDRFGEANRFASQTFDPSTQSEVLTLNFLGIGFTNGVLLGVELA